MAFTLPDLPYAKDALAPYLSQETLEFHHDKHHNAYVTNLNGLIEGTEHAAKSLEEIILAAEGPLFNNAAQVWNHTFYWNCMKPGAAARPAVNWPRPSTTPSDRSTTSRRRYRRPPSGQFGSGWAWLVLENGTLEDHQDEQCRSAAQARPDRTADH